MTQQQQQSPDSKMIIATASFDCTIKLWDTVTANPINSHIITGWVVEIFPEDWVANLEALRYELIAANKPKWYVRFITVINLLDMLCGGIRVTLQNLDDGDDLMAAIGRHSTIDDRDNSIDE